MTRFDIMHFNGISFENVSSGSLDRGTSEIPVQLDKVLTHHLKDSDKGLSDHLEDSDKDLTDYFRNSDKDLSD